MFFKTKRAINAFLATILVAANYTYYFPRLEHYLGRHMKVEPKDIPNYFVYSSIAFTLSCLLALIPLRVM